MSPHRRGQKDADQVAKERVAVEEILLAAGAPLTREQVRDQYREKTGESIPYSTLKKRLQEMVSRGLIDVSPEGRRPVVYQRLLNWVQEGGDTAPPAVSRPTETHDEIPMSSEAKVLRTLLHRPRTERTLVGYDTGFLDRYQPGQTWYLDSALRERLGELGRTTYMNQPAGTYARDIMGRLVIDLSWGSSRLEGLKYSRIDTAELLNADKTPRGASDTDRQLILNHKSAIEFLVEEAEAIAFNRYTILNLHGLLSENLLERREDEGALRTRGVLVGSSVYTPTEIPQVIEERFDTILEKAEAIPDPIEQAFFVMVHIPYLQPFIDANKRTSRLAANIPLIRTNLCPLSFVDVPEQSYTDAILGVYELRDVSMLRDVFAWAYERSCAQFKVLREAMGEPDPIRLNYRTELRELVRDVVRALAWPVDEDLRKRGLELDVPQSDLHAFTIEARKDLQSLRPDILARYALRKSEFDRWAEAVASARNAAGS